MGECRGRVGAEGRRSRFAKSRAMPQHGLCCCSDGERKGQDKEGSQEVENKKDMKEAEKQERRTLTKDGKAWSRDLCPIRETGLNERLQHPHHHSLSCSLLHSSGFISHLNKGSISLQ